MATKQHKKLNWIYWIDNNNQKNKRNNNKKVNLWFALMFVSWCPTETEPIATGGRVRQLLVAGMYTQ